MNRICLISTTAYFLICILSTAVGPQAAARARKGKKGQNKAVMVMQVGETQMLLFRDFRSPKIKNPAIVKLVKNKRKRCYFLKAKKRGVTVMTYNTPYFPERSKVKLKLKIIVR